MKKAFIERFKGSDFLNWYHWLVIIASLILTISAWKISEDQIQIKRTELFKIQTEHLLAQIKERMSHYEVALKSGASAIQTFGKNTRSKDWKAYSDTLNLTNTYPGINGIGVIYYVPEEKLTNFLIEQQIHRPNFKIHPLHNKKEFWPITYIEPVLSNSKAVGLDMAFENSRFIAAKEARDTATTQITAPIVLVQDEKKTPGFLQYIPFYNHSDISTFEKRQKHFIGHVYAPFIMYKLVEGTLGQSNRQIIFSITDGVQSLYNELKETNPHYDKNTLFNKEVTIKMYGRPWTFKIQTALSFKKSTHSDQPMLILSTGIIIDIMLLIIFLMLKRSQKKAVNIAQNMTKALTIREAYYRHILESAPCGMIIINKEGEIETINPQAALLFGYEESELMGKKVEMLLPIIYQQSHPSLRESFNQNPSNRKMGSGREVFGLRKNGKEFHAEIGIAQFEDGYNTKTLATIIDITTPVNITNELKRSNKELNDFAYVASHDLKAPLRGIMQLSSWIEEDINEFATDDTKKNLHLLMNRTERLECLLDDLLAYSRIGQHKDVTQLVNMNELILHVFDLQSPSKEIKIHCENTLPIFNTYLTPIEVICRNLISNAIKHRDKDDLVINVSSTENESHYTFTISDNGSGISAKHHEKIFELFKTLKPRDEIEGSGMGLSIIKKLLDYQNCDIKVSSDGINGSSFTFTWPK